MEINRKHAIEKLARHSSLNDVVIIVLKREKLNYMKFMYGQILAN